jgi:hypothetical protein
MIPDWIYAAQGRVDSVWMFTVFSLIWATGGVYCCTGSVVVSVVLVHTLYAYGHGVQTYKLQTLSSKADHLHHF